MTTGDAGVLRKAAALMRERAQAATGGTWSVGRDGVVSDREPTAEERNTGHGEVEHYGGLLIGKSFYRRNAEHVASWHPAVALAVADWLDHEAVACGLNRAPFVDETHTLAHTVATAYLGEPSP